MSLIDAFRYSNFIRDEESFASTESRGAGLPRYGGETSRLSEYSSRVRARMAKEKLIGEDEVKKLGPLGLRLVEGLSGSAFKVAQQIPTKVLASPEGAEELLGHLTQALKPRRTQEARELYQAGATPQGGIMSRQPQEPMATYVLRRRAWYAAWIDLDERLKLPESILAEQTLLNSGISADHQLLIRSAIAGDTTVEKVNAELIAQRSRVHDPLRWKMAPLHRQLSHLPGPLLKQRNAFALQSNEMVLNQDDLDMVMLREALGGEVPQESDPLPLEDQKTTPPPGLSNIFRGITSFFGHQPAYPLPGDLQDLPCMDMDLEAEMSSHFAIEDRFPEHFKDSAPPDPGQQRRDERAALSMRSAQIDKDDALARKQALCSHANTTTSGSNAYYFRKSCKDCDKILERYKKTSSTTTSSTADAKKATSMTCPHYNVSWHGTNGHRWKQTCKDCGDVKTGPVKGRDTVSKDGAGTTSSTSSRAPPQVCPAWNHQCLQRRHDDAHL